MDNVNKTLIKFVMVTMGESKGRATKLSESTFENAAKVISKVSCDSQERLIWKPLCKEREKAYL